MCKKNLGHTGKNWNSTSRKEISKWKNKCELATIFIIPARQITTRRNNIHFCVLDEISVAKIIASNWVSMPEWRTERDGKYISIFWNDLASIDPYHFFFPHFGLTYYQVEFNYLFSLLYVNIHRHTHTINDCEHHKNRPTDKPQTLNCLNM